MEEDIISKKELLEIFNISYGALYRYKRKGLIPEEWFIRKSTVTGQETFFPKKLICNRIKLILEQLEESSLDELSIKLNENNDNKYLVVETVFGEKTIKLKDIKSIKIKTKESINDITNKILGGF